MRLVSLEHIHEASAITHSGVFHADEVLATAILDLAFEDLVVCRIPDDSALVLADAIVYDIGYGEFDHHQPGGNGLRTNGIPYASAGLIWLAFGMRVVSGSPDPQKAWDYVDRNLIQGVDAADCGCSRNSAIVHDMTFSQIVSMMNPQGNESASCNKAFDEAVELAQSVLVRTINYAEQLLYAETQIREALSYSDHHILELPAFVPWQEALIGSLREEGEDVYFVVHPSSRGGYAWQCVPHEVGGRSYRVDVPETWRGKKNGELREVTGVPGAMFCHESGFMGVAESIDDVRDLLFLAMSYFGSKKYCENPESRKKRLIRQCEERS